ncbi:peptide-methionine (S)-S-oxide reductase MsrA [Synoicihabitans lomoniglobus]|uniref:Peptide methionine sulfoxide reductase MsrA n=1 Tax=Synoicihabitans lomoniglobus TaxID=2909285 RepID=A0AAF0I2J1_9BACT|nr:peptide-methionine (S)-S-oxide reductase MsrA [Opitutaceae bacterium LMO-M01]WED65773.1 peptide-methionine (S)-S-oxide reductase MsrA [Opitutaceae bacterium LMO-M01]
MKRLIAVFLCAAGISVSQGAEPQKATLGAGCFWCVEAIYEQLPGVLNVVSGYAGGPEVNPTYKQVSYGQTGHAEVVQITFDPDQTSYRDLIDYFWKTHDVTDPRGVWPDFGPQYRSIILAHNDEQLEIAKASRGAARARFDKRIVTEIVMLDTFYPAEDYHQDFVRLNPNHSYVRSIAYKKLDKLGLKYP